MKRIFSFCFVFGLSMAVFPQEPPVRLLASAAASRTNATEGNRFLFVVDTSAAMLELEHGGRQAVFDLIYYGISGHLRSGDTFGLWTFNEDVYGGIYPMQTYDPQIKLQLASSAGLFLRQQKYEKKSRIEAVLAKTTGLVKTVKDVNILVISSAETLVDTTSWNSNATWHTSTNLLQARHGKKPVILTLAARNGDIVTSSMTVAGEPISLPPETPKPLPAPATPPPLAASGKESNSKLPVKNIIMSQKESGSGSDQSSASNPSSESNAPVAAQTKTSAPERGDEDPEKAGATVTRVKESTMASTNAGTPATRTTPFLPAVPVAAREATAMQPTQAIIPAPAPGRFTRQKLFWAGALMAFFAGGLIAGLAWQNRPKRSSSYISRSFGSR